MSALLRQATASKAAEASDIPPLVLSTPDSRRSSVWELSRVAKEEQGVGSLVSKRKSSSENLSEDNKTVWEAGQRNPRYFTADGQRTRYGRIRVVLDSFPATILMVFCTVWALFAIDFTILALPKSADTGMLAVLFVVFILFCIEVPLELYTQGWAYMEFYFWLDTFTTLSLLPDIVSLFTETSKSRVLDVLTLARAGRAARASSRASRIIRFIKLLSNSGYLRKKVKVRDFDLDEGDSAEDVQSLVGQRFIESTTRRVVFVVILVLFMLALIDLISPDDIISATTGLRGAADQLYLVYMQQQQNLNSSAIANSTAALLTGEFFTTSMVPAFRQDFDKVIQFSILGKTIFDDTPTSNARESLLLDIDSSPKGQYAMIFDSTRFAQMVAGSNILLVFLVIVILVIGNLFFILKADKLVINPVERMTMIVRQLAKNPLTQLKKSELDHDGETGLVLQMFRKLVGLVQVGFGEAGARVIAENLADGGTLDVMKKGLKMRAIFGFCDIRNFTDMTEILNEDCMFLVNSIANILHTNVHSRYGSANKNIGDAFLLVWRTIEQPFSSGASFRGRRAGSVSVRPTTSAGAGLGGSGASSTSTPNLILETPHAASGSSGGEPPRSPVLGPLSSPVPIPIDASAPAGASGTPGKLSKRNSTSASSLPDTPGNLASKLAAVRSMTNIINDTTIACNALNSFLHTIRDMRNSPTLLAIGKKAPKYHPIKMGYGLHVGWAIEGAIGSTYKVDASYLSPHVNMSSRLESLTKSYGATILMSGEFHALLSDGWKQRCRLIDIITVKGSSIPLEMFTIDDETPVEDEDDLMVPSVDTDNSLIKYKELHSLGMRAFIKGDWVVAIDKLQQYYAETEDKPSSILIEWMKAVGDAEGNPPASFEGFRRLTEK